VHSGGGVKVSVSEGVSKTTVGAGVVDGAGPLMGVLDGAAVMVAIAATGVRAANLMSHALRVSCWLGPTSATFVELPRERVRRRATEHKKRLTTVGTQRR
jgi:hypothetical protein